MLIIPAYHVVKRNSDRRQQTHRNVRDRAPIYTQCQSTIFVPNPKFTTHGIVAALERCSSSTLRVELDTKANSRTVPKTGINPMVA